jgi:hypothetical protein
MNSRGGACPGQGRARSRIGAFFLGASLLVGCASHSDKTKEIRSALDAGRPKAALKLLNEQLEIDSEQQLPENTGGDNALFLLDRAMVLQQLQVYKLSSRDLEVSDKQIDMLDFSRNTAHDIGKYLFSDDSGPYKAPPYEKLMINTMNMVNYLAQGDLQGARVEARRLAVMQKYLKDNDPDNALTAPGSYLAGFTFEKSGQYDEALRYYDEALQYGDYRSLAEPVRRLSGRSGYSSPRLKKLAGPDAATPTTAATPAAPAPAEPEQGELLVIVSYGRVPAKIARRVPIGLALTYASGALSPGDRSQANALAAQGLVTWVNFPELGKAHGQYDAPSFSLDGKLFPLEGIVAVDHEAKKAWEEVKGTVVASAITRMIARVVAGKGVEAAAGNDNAVAGLLLSLATQATLTAADTPDTRSWATLPARMAFGRVMLPAGTRMVQLNARGAQTVKKVTIKPGGFAVVNLTVLE